MQQIIYLFGCLFGYFEDVSLGIVKVYYLLRKTKNHNSLICHSAGVV